MLNRNAIVFRSFRPFALVVQSKKRHLYTPLIFKVEKTFRFFSFERLKSLCGWINKAFRSASCPNRTSPPSIQKAARTPVDRGIKAGFQHEIRTPLTVILGMLLFLKKTSLDTAQRHCIEGIVRSANELLAFADSLKSPYLELEFVEVAKKPTEDHKKIPRVLLIENHPLIQFLHKTMLMETGCNVDAASTGEAALKLADNPYDLILIDTGLSGINGIEVAKRLRQHKNHAKTRMVTITAHANERDCLAVGIEEVIYKPVGQETFNRLIRSLHSHQGKGM